MIWIKSTILLRRPFWWLWKLVYLGGDVAVISLWQLSNNLGSLFFFRVFIFNCLFIFIVLLYTFFHRHNFKMIKFQNSKFPKFRQAHGAQIRWRSRVHVPLWHPPSLVLVPAGSSLKRKSEPLFWKNQYCLFSERERRKLNELNNIEKNNRISIPPTALTISVARCVWQNNNFWLQFGQFPCFLYPSHLR